MIAITLRRLLRSPAYSLTVATIVAVGIGALALVTAFLHGALINAFPYSEPDRIAFAFAERSSDGVERYGFTGAEYAAIRDGGAFEVVAGFGGGTFNLTGDGFPQRVRGLVVTGEFFDVFGTPPVAGRYFGPDDAGRDDLAVVNEIFARQNFGGIDDVVGREIVLNGTVRTIVGVAPARFRFIGADVFTHTRTDPASAPESARYYAIGRIPAGLGADAFADRLNGSTGAIAPEWRLDLTPITDNLERIAPSLVALGFAAAVLLALVVSNVAGLQLVRLERRREETAVMLATGATTTSVVRGWLTETVLLFAAGAAVGLGAAYLLIDPFVVLVSGRAGGLELVPPEARIAIDATTVAVAMGATFVAALLTAWVPVLRARRLDVARVLHGSRGTRGLGVQGMLVTAQIAVTTMLIAIAAVVASSHGRLLEQGLGFDPDGVQTFQVALHGGAYPDAASRHGYYSGLVEALESIPGAERAGGAHLVQLEGFERRTDVRLGGVEVSTLYNDVLPGYFETLRAPILAGRAFSGSDDADSEPVVMVNRAFAEEHFAGGAVGEVIVDPDGIARRVIGVVGDMRQFSVRLPTEPEVYFPYLQAASPPGWAAIVVRGSVTAEQIRLVLSGIDPEIPAFSMRSMQSIVDVAFGVYRLTRSVLAVFVIAAVSLAMVGVYGLIAQFVSQRRREIGVRTALGAGRSNIAWLVLEQSLKLVVVGAAVGVALTAASETVVSHLLIGIEALEFTRMSLIVIAVTGIAVFAALPPLVAAIRVDPSTVLREE